MNIGEELRRNRKVFAAAESEQERRAGAPVQQSVVAGPARPPGRGDGVADAPDGARPRPSGTAEGEAGPVRMPVQAYSLRAPGVEYTQGTGRFAAEPAGPLQRAAPVPAPVEGGQVAPPGAVDGAMRFPAVETPPTSPPPVDAVDGLLRRMESEARLQSQLLDEELP